MQGTYFGTCLSSNFIHRKNYLSAEVLIEEVQSVVLGTDELKSQEESLA